MIYGNALALETSSLIKLLASGGLRATAVIILRGLHVHELHCNNTHFLIAHCAVVSILGKGTICIVLIADGIISEPIT